MKFFLKVEDVKILRLYNFQQKFIKNKLRIKKLNLDTTSYGLFRLLRILTYCIIN